MIVYAHLFLFKMTRYDITLSENKGIKTILSVVKSNNWLNPTVELKIIDEKIISKYGLEFDAKEFKWFITKIHKCILRGLWITKNSEIYFEFPGDKNMYLTLYQNKSGHRVLWNFTSED